MTSRELEITRKGFSAGTYGFVWALAFVFGPSLGLLAFCASPLALWSFCGVMGVAAAGIILSEASRWRMSSLRLVLRKLER